MDSTYLLTTWHAVGASGAARPEEAVESSASRLAECVEKMTRLYEATRFGRAPADPRALAHCLHEVETCLP